jgi:alanine racemase
VGYGKIWIAKKQSTIGIIPVGYHDGFRRTPNNHKHVLCCNQIIPIIGNVMMNYTILDLTNISKTVKIGNEVVIVGKQSNKLITFEEIATNTNTINEEIATSISSSIPRIYKI